MSIRTRLRREDGAAAVEFALIVGVLAMLIFGINMLLTLVYVRVLRTERYY